ncbi:MAG TPA: right-handed parallel beta-helix repeat-containing protein [Sphingobacteriaceae bacterium]|nr:right-handed parallel beta-helix repeat-containing protein [Sphingobacteriaceae bacterium]
MLKYIITCCLVLIFAAQQQVHGQKRIIYAKDFLSASDSDAVPGVLRLLKATKESKAEKIIFQKGTYHFYDDHAFEKYAYISNHDSGMRRIAFPIIDFHNLEIDGGSAEFIMHGLIIPYAIENSSNIKISNLRVNWLRPTHSELKVVGVSKGNKNPYIDFEINDEYPYEIKNGELLFIKKGFHHNLENAVYWDPKTDAVAFQSRQISPPLNQQAKPSVKNWKDSVATLYSIDTNDPAYRNRGIENSLLAHQLKPGLVRLTGVKPQMPEIGWVLIAKGMNGFNRLAPAFRLVSSDNVEINNVTVHHASGMGLIAENCRDITLNKFNVFPDKKDGRMIATTADATHFVGCRGTVKLENCHFENQYDDATNIHGTYVEITEIKNNTAGVRIGHFQQVGYDFARPGDSIGVVNPNESSLPVARLTITEVEKVNPRYYRITFAETLPGNIKKGYYLENLQAYPEVEIKNSRFVNNRARGLLISTPRKVLIEGNTFSNMMSAIQCPNEFTFWYESGYVRDLTIRNNTFLDGSYGVAKPTALINILAVSNNKRYIHDRITIENNTFTTFASAILSAEFVNDITFRNNVIKYSGTYPLNSESPVIKLEHVGNANIISNKYDPAFKHFIFNEYRPLRLINESNEILEKTK